jgi:predicted peptidase
MLLFKKFEIRSHIFQNTALPYRIYIPENYDSSKSYPLLLALHGAGERGFDNEIQIRKHSLGTAWANSAVQQKNPCIIVAPQ